MPLFNEIVICLCTVFFVFHNDICSTCIVMQNKLLSLIDFLDDVFIERVKENIFCYPVPPQQIRVAEFPTS